MKWNKIVMIACGVLFVCSIAQTVQHIGFCRGWEGQFFASDIDATTITCNTLVCALYWLREVFDYATKDF